jgi:hypothetical protein
MALALVAELMEWLGAGRIAAALRRRMARDVAALERFATGIVVLTALRSLPKPLPVKPGPRRPFSAPRGFARVAASERHLRAMQRKLFPRERDLRRRLARFDAVLDDVAGAAARLARHIAHIPPASRLVAIAPPAMCVLALATVAANADDTS